MPKLEVSPIPGATDLTVISWNVDGWHTIRDAQVELIDASGAELAVLQEVTSESAKRLRLAGWQLVTALELCPPNRVEGLSPGLVEISVCPQFQGVVL